MEKVGYKNEIVRKGNEKKEIGEEGKGKKGKE